jgi:CRISPR-associated protein Cas5d
VKKSKIFTYQVFGPRALFSDPIVRIGGEKTSYHFPTYQALKGITESIYWKPSLIWRVLRVRIMNPIQTESVGIRPMKYSSDGNELAYYTYLKDVCYKVQVQFEFNPYRPEFKHDWNIQKHEAIFERSLKKGGRRDIFLGTRECQGYVLPTIFDEEEGAFDAIEELSYGLQYHSLIYPDEAPPTDDHNPVIITNLWFPIMRKGVIDFPAPEDCEIRRSSDTVPPKVFDASPCTDIENGVMDA